MRMRFVKTFIILITLPASVWTSCSGLPWQPTWTNDTVSDLVCGDYCTPQLDSVPGNEEENNVLENYDTCCTCHSCMQWEGTEINLYITYSETNVYKVEYKNSVMTEIPSNLCNWDPESMIKENFPKEFTDMELISRNIVAINFEKNMIQNLPDMNCLIRLDNLDLRDNEISHISNGSFTNLTKLREINLSGNHVKTMDINVFLSPQLRLFHANVSHNQMTEIDVTNMISLHPFCEINLESNDITKIVNKGPFHFDLKKVYGPGFVSLQDNKFTIWPDFKELLNLTDLSQLGRMINVSFDFRNVPLTCDCHMEPFMARAKISSTGLIWRSHHNVICAGPETPKNLTGMRVIDVALEDLVCPLSAESGCPTPKCKCVDKPNEDTLYVDCSNSNLKHLPELQLSKFSKYLSLNVSGNQIKDVADMPYLPSISMLDISRNQVSEINNSIARVLENSSYINLSDNPDLGILPQTFQYRNVCSTGMKHLVIECNCDSLWIETWLKSRKCSNNNVFECNIPDLGLRPATDFSEATLICSTSGLLHLYEITMAGVIFMTILTGIIVYIFRYELLIIMLRVKQTTDSSMMSDFKYDVFLSYKDTEPELYKWVNYTLEKSLTDAGYRVFQPNRDIPYGEDITSRIVSVLAKTRDFLMILSENYLTEEQEEMPTWTKNEWKYGWHNFKADRSKKIILVNFDHMSSFDIKHSQIKAYLRVGYTVDFKNQNRSIIPEILQKLGPPCRNRTTVERSCDKRKCAAKKDVLFADQCDNGDKNIPGRMQRKEKKPDLAENRYSMNPQDAGDIQMENLSEYRSNFRGIETGQQNENIVKVHCAFQNNMKPNIPQVKMRALQMTRTNTISDIELSVNVGETVRKSEIAATKIDSDNKSKITSISGYRDDENNGNNMRGDKRLEFHRSDVQYSKVFIQSNSSGPVSESGKRARQFSACEEFEHLGQSRRPTSNQGERIRSSRAASNRNTLTDIHVQ